MCKTKGETIMNLNITPVKINTQNNSIKNKENPAFGSFDYYNAGSKLLNYNAVRTFKSKTLSRIIKFFHITLKKEISQAHVLKQSETDSNRLNAVYNVLTNTNLIYKNDDGGTGVTHAMLTGGKSVDLFDVIQGKSIEIYNYHKTPFETLEIKAEDDKAKMVFYKIKGYLEKAKVNKNN